MIIVMERGAGADEIAHVCRRITENGFEPRQTTGIERTLVSVIGDDRPWGFARYAGEI